MSAAPRRDREPQPPRASRAARAEALAQLIARRGGRLRLTRGALQELGTHGINRGAVDQSVDTLAAAGRITVSAEDGVVVLTLTGEATP